jgi:membrane protease YdiL (CAAX protease family)
VLLLLLALVFGLMRAAGQLGAKELRFLLPLGFCLMMVLPWILLTPAGRAQVGLARPKTWTVLLPAILAGGIAALVCFGIGAALFGHGRDNWYVSIANNYRGVFDTSRLTLLQLYMAFTVPAMVFSPIGEEIFFRGVLQQALEERVGVRRATAAEAALFGLVHLCHHGLLPTAAGIILLPLSGAIWVVLMFLAAVLFAALRKKSGSLYPAMAAHAAFNAAMNALIFAFLW